ncbi:hypothetical protein V6R21_31060 [Limibacter armeniacum]|uniref:hypothetical protein n=1 Tax=Limibacter armeniacum TaxID=466084 RepID=UPI002FE5C8E2
MNIFLVAVAGTLGALITFWLNVKLHQGPVRASALVALVIGLVFYLYPNCLGEYLSTHLPIVVIGASFVGMASLQVTPQFRWVALSGFVFSILYLNSSRFFQGFGGALGTAACLSLVLVLGVSHLFKKRSN